MVDLLSPIFNFWNAIGGIPGFVLCWFLSGVIGMMAIYRFDPHHNSMNGQDAVLCILFGMFTLAMGLWDFLVWTKESLGDLWHYLADVTVLERKR